MPSGASADDIYAATDVAVTVVDSSQSAATFFSKSNDFELAIFITEDNQQPVAMDRSQNKSRGKRSSSRESAQRAKRFHSSDEEEFDDVVCDLKFGDYSCTDERAPYCEISHEVTSPQVHQYPREGPDEAATDS